MQRNVNSNGDGVKFRCPCINCLNEWKLDVNKIKEHLLCDGFLRPCTVWTWHDELLHLISVSIFQKYVQSTMDDDWLEDMICDVGAKSFIELHGYEIMSTNVETPLYPESTNFTWLSTMLRLTNLKTMNEWKK